MFVLSFLSLNLSSVSFDLRVLVSLRDERSQVKRARELSAFRLCIRGTSLSAARKLGKKCRGCEEEETTLSDNQGKRSVCVGLSLSRLRGESSLVGDFPPTSLMRNYAPPLSLSLFFERERKLLVSARVKKAGVKRESPAVTGEKQSHRGV